MYSKYVPFLAYVLIHNISFSFCLDYRMVRYMMDLQLSQIEGFYSPIVTN